MTTKWPSIRLGEVLHLDLDRVPVNPGARYPMVGVLSFGRGLFEREPIENGKTSYRVFYRLKAEHVVMSQLFGWEGALALSSEIFAGKFVSPQFPTFLCDATKLDRTFLGWLMRRPSFWEDLGTRASGMGDRRRTLNPDALFACDIPLPPLAEQGRVVARIEELVAQIQEARILRQQAAQETESILRSSASALYQSCSPRLASLGEIIGADSLRNGKSVKPDASASEIRCLTLSAIRQGRVDLRRSKAVPMTSDEAQSFLVRRNDVFIVRGNGSKDLCGLACRVEEEEPGVIFPDLLIRVPLPADLLPEFFVAVWNSPAIREVIEEKAKTTSGIWKINQGHILSTSIPVPPIAEQRRIVAELEALQAEVDALKGLQAETAVELDAMLPAVLSKAFMGEL